MNEQLQRIETTLDKLERANPAYIQAIPITVPAQNDSRRSHPQVTDNLASVSMTINTRSARKQSVKTPVLPQIKPTQPDQLRPEVNRTPVISVLHRIEGIIANWEQELQQVLQLVQDIYLEGPMIDGWLETDAGETKAGIKKINQISGNKLNFKFNSQGYRLCGIDENRQLWCRVCPTDQVDSVVAAINRYQKLRQLLERKDYLENRLYQVTETLTVMHNHLSQR